MDRTSCETQQTSKNGPPDNEGNKYTKQRIENHSTIEAEHLKFN